MKTLLLFLSLLLPVSLFGQAVSRNELLQTNNLIRSQHVRVFDTIAQMIASTTDPSTNACYVKSYSGTNGIGGGIFDLRGTNGYATNYGTVFASQSPKKFWVRRQENNNVFRLEWFGVTGSGNESNLVQNAIDTMPNYSSLLWPNQRVTCAITISNRSGLSFVGESFPQGARNGLTGPYVVFGGVTNTPAVKIWNSAYIVWDGIAVATDDTSNTNHANCGIDVDMPNSGGQTTTGTRIKNAFIYSRHKGNTNWVGIYLSRTSLQNVEDSHIQNCTIYGSGTGANWQDNLTNSGPAIWLSGSDNVYETVVSHLNIAYVSVGIRQDGGGLRVSDIYSPRIPTVYELNARNTTTLIENDHSEIAQTLARIRSGSGSVVFRGIAFNDDNSVTTTNPAILLDGVNSGIGSITLEDCKFFAYPWRKITSVSTNSARFSLVTRQCQFFQATNFGFNEFNSWVGVNDYIYPFWGIAGSGDWTNNGSASVTGKVTAAAFDVKDPGGVAQIKMRTAASGSGYVDWYDYLGNRLGYMGSDATRLNLQLFVPHTINGDKFGYGTTNPTNSFDVVGSFGVRGTNLFFPDINTSSNASPVAALVVNATGKIQVGALGGGVGNFSTNANGSPYFQGGLMTNVGSTAFVKYVEAYGTNIGYETWSANPISWSISERVGSGSEQFLVIQGGGTDTATFGTGNRPISVGITGDLTVDGTMTVNVFSTGKFIVLSNTVEFPTLAWTNADLNLGSTRWVQTNSMTGNQVFAVTNIAGTTNSAIHFVFEGEAAGGTDRFVTNTVYSIGGTIPVLLRNGSAAVQASPLVWKVPAGTVLEGDIEFTFQRGTNFGNALTNLYTR